MMNLASLTPGYSFFKKLILLAFLSSITFACWASDDALTPLGRQAKHRTQPTAEELEIVDQLQGEIQAFYTNEALPNLKQHPLIMKHPDLLRALADQNNENTFESCTMEAMLFRLSIAVRCTNNLEAYHRKTNELVKAKKKSLQTTRKKDGTKYSKHEIDDRLAALRQERANTRDREFRGFLNMSPFSDSFVESYVMGSAYKESVVTHLLDGVRRKILGSPSLSISKDAINGIQQQLSDSIELSELEDRIEWLKLIGLFGSVKQRHKAAKALLAEYNLGEEETILWQLHDEGEDENSPYLDDYNGDSRLIEEYSGDDKEIVFDPDTLKMQVFPSEGSPYLIDAAVILIRPMEFKYCESYDPEYGLMVLKGAQLYLKVDEIESAQNAWSRVHTILMVLLNSRYNYVDFIEKLLPEFLTIALELNRLIDNPEMNSSIHSLMRELLTHNKMKSKYSLSTRSIIESTKPMFQLKEHSSSDDETTLSDLE